MARLFVLLLVLVPQLAHACPACLGQQASWSTSLELLGVFILFPFVVAVMVLRAIRNAQRELDDKPRR